MSGRSMTVTSGSVVGQTDTTISYAKTRLAREATYKSHRKYRTVPSCRVLWHSLAL